MMKSFDHFLSRSSSLRARRQRSHNRNRTLCYGVALGVALALAGLAVVPAVHRAVAGTSAVQQAGVDRQGRTASTAGAGSGRGLAEQYGKPLQLVSKVVSKTVSALPSTAADEVVAALAPDDRHLAIAAHARTVRVFTYDLAGAGFQPSLDLLAPNGPGCKCHTIERKTFITPPGFPHDICNYEYGKIHRPPFAEAFQGNYWGNHQGGESVSTVVAHRLANGPRSEPVARKADLLFIPFQTRNMCEREDDFLDFQQCGVDYKAGRDVPGMWKWLLRQSSFSAKQGRKHFLIVEQPWIHFNFQCQMFNFTDRSLYSADEAQKLEAYSQNIHIMMLDSSLAHSIILPQDTWPKLWHYIPYKTNWHYVPQGPPAPAAIAGPTFNATTFDAPTAQVAPAPHKLAWDPSVLSSIERPYLMSYVGSSQRVVNNAGMRMMGKPPPLWQIKLLVNKECIDSEDCHFYELEDRAASAERMIARHDADTARSQLGYPQPGAFKTALGKYVEPIYMMSKFCLCPPGDTPKRRAFYDAMILGCVPVVFFEASRALAWWIPPKRANETSVLIPPETLSKPGALAAELRKLEPQLPQMQANLARMATSLQYSYADLTREDHERLGPDAVDVMLWGMTWGRDVHEQPYSRYKDHKELMMMSTQVTTEYLDFLKSHRTAGA